MKRAGKKKKAKGRRFTSGHLFEDFVLGKHEMQKFPSILNSSDDALFANAVMAQPKDHDPDEPTEKWLVIMLNKISRSFGSRVSLYICNGLPIDLQRSTDLMVVSWEFGSFVTVDLTLDRGGESKADIKFLQSDLRPEQMDKFCLKVAELLEQNENRITPEMLALVGRK
jgi:hypothetical protein